MSRDERHDEHPAAEGPWWAGHGVGEAAGRAPWSWLWEPELDAGPAGAGDRTTGAAEPASARPRGTAGRPSTGGTSSAGTTARHPRRTGTGPRGTGPVAGARRVRRRRRLVPIATAVLLLVALVRAATDDDPRRVGASASDRVQARSTAASRAPFELTWVGDVTLGWSAGLPPDAARGTFDAVRDDLRADLQLGNYEGTFGTGGATKCAGAAGGACFAFQAPPENAGALREAGFDVVSTANNHAFDAGAAGLGSTVRAVEDAGLRTNGRPGEITVVRRAGRRIAIVGFASYEWSSPLTDLAAVRAYTAAAAKRADVVVVTFHGGAEGAAAQRTPVGTETAFGEDRGDVRRVARTAIDAGADAVLGAGPHVLRGMEVYRGRLIAYSLGNFAGYRNFSTGGPMGVSAVLRLRLDGDGRSVGGRLHPVRLAGPGVPEPDPSGAAIDSVADLSRQDFGADGVPIDDEGRLLGDARGRAAGGERAVPVGGAPQAADAPLAVTAG